MQADCASTLPCASGSVPANNARHGHESQKLTDVDEFAAGREIALLARLIQPPLRGFFGALRSAMSDLNSRLRAQRCHSTASVCSAAALKSFAHHRSSTASIASAAAFSPETPATGAADAAASRPSSASAKSISTAARSPAWPAAGRREHARAQPHDPIQARRGRSPRTRREFDEARRQDADQLVIQSRAKRTTIPENRAGHHLEHAGIGLAGGIDGGRESVARVHAQRPARRFETLPSEKRPRDRPPARIRLRKTPTRPVGRRTASAFGSEGHTGNSAKVIASARTTRTSVGSVRNPGTGRNVISPPTRASTSRNAIHAC